MGIKSGKWDKIGVNRDLLPGEYVQVLAQVSGNAGIVGQTRVVPYIHHHL